MKKVKKLGFSLVELMVSLVVVSCITAAMTPIITKKLSSNGVSLGSDTSISSICQDICPECELCNEEKCLQCKNTCEKGQYQNATGATSCILCSEGTYSNAEGKDTCPPCPEGSTCLGGTLKPIAPQEPQAPTCSSNQYLKNNSCINCSSTYPNCSTCSASNCTSCNSGYELKNGTCESKGFSYTYTGSYSELSSQTGTLKILLKSSGTLTPKGNASATVHLIGGGGSCGWHTYTTGGNGGSGVVIIILD